MVVALIADLFAGGMAILFSLLDSSLLEPSLAFLIYKLFFITLGRLGRVLARL